MCVFVSVNDFYLCVVVLKNTKTLGQQTSLSLSCSCICLTFIFLVSFCVFVVVFFWSGKYLRRHKLDNSIKNANFTIEIRFQNVVSVEELYN